MMSSFREQGYLDFLETHNLIGRAMIHREVVLTNSPNTDPRSGGVPPGHPALHSFLGMPSVRNGAVIGMDSQPQERIQYSGEDH
jgi:hypothetical protein